MKIAIGCDHGGYALKLAVKGHLEDKGYEVVDYGCDGPESVDYPIYGERVGRAVAGGECALGVLICGTGIGISLAANRVHGIRAAVCSESYSAELTRRHNDANMIAFGARIVGPQLAEAIVDAFIETEPEGGRHAERVKLIMKLEQEQTTH